ncbi:MAG TPA: hypothetical protein VH107_00305 [Lacipirellulaceae bacterium]|nr:hypothetical protein [Lacipirellulaceae bacterium]
MRTTPSTNDIQPEDYPALRSLRLGRADLDTLAQQGFITGECRGAMHYLKLRFRREGRQHVRHVRPEIYAAVVEELERLQARTRRHLALRSESREIRAAIKASEAVLRAALETSGLYFHGRTLRAKRKAKAR